MGGTFCSIKTGNWRTGPAYLPFSIRRTCSRKDLPWCIIRGRSPCPVTTSPPGARSPFDYRTAPWKRPSPTKPTSMDQNISYEAAFRELKEIETDIAGESISVDVLAEKVQRASFL